jgi:hypothetical protein
MTVATRHSSDNGDDSNGGEDEYYGANGKQFTSTTMTVATRAASDNGDDSNDSEDAYYGANGK